MFIAASDEFVALCRTQVALLGQSLGAALSVVYLTEDVADDALANLRPVVASPEVVMTWSAERLLTWLTQGGWQEPLRRPELPFSRGDVFREDDALGNVADDRLLPVVDGAFASMEPEPPDLTDLPMDDWPSPELPADWAEVDAPGETTVDSDSSSPRPIHQLILPLAQENVVMGALVVARGDRPWTNHEHAQIEQIAQALAIARLLDQRSQWLSQQLRQQRQIQSQQQDVLGDLLHQFRNPLTAIRTLGKLFLRRLSAEDKNRVLAGNLVEESDRLVELLNQFDHVIDLDEEGDRAGQEGPPLLLPSRHFLVGAEVMLQPVSLPDVVAPLLRKATLIAQEQQTTVTATLGESLPAVVADPKALREVFNNLLDNAVKYTPTGGEVWVWVGDRHVQNAQVYQAVAIADNGPGIPAADLSHIFERHYRGVQSQTETPGTGLGLAIAQDLLQHMNGFMQVYSPLSTWPSYSLAPCPLPLRHSHHGTVFIVWLPEVPDG